MICSMYITKCIENKNKGKHLQMGKRSKQPKVYQKIEAGFLLFKKLINPDHMTPCLPYIFLTNGHMKYIYKVVMKQVKKKKRNMEHTDYSLCKS